MAKVLLKVAAVLVSLWLVAWLVAMIVARDRLQRPWPGKLGTLLDVPARIQQTDDSPGATELARLTFPLGIEVRPRDEKRNETPAMQAMTKLRTGLNEYTRVQFERSSGTIDPPPLEIVEFLAAHTAELDAIRDHLLSGKEVAWRVKFAEGFNAPIPNLLGHMDVERLLIVRAFERARAGDPTAWNELRAAWELNRGLWKRPEVISSLIALAMNRMTNAAAAKMPAPEPAWMNELRSLDERAAMMAAHQTEAYVIYRYASMDAFDDDRPPGVRMFRKVALKIGAPYMRVSAAETVEYVRANAEAVAAMSECDFDSAAPASMRKPPAKWNVIGSIAIPNLNAAWQRAFRYRAERELTEKVLQLRAGQTPTANSRCSDGTWLVKDGTIRFSRPIAVPEPGTKFPLDYAPAAVVPVPAPKP